MQNIENLLSQVKTINESFKLVAEATGDNFNIFSVLGIEQYEVSTHSLFLAELLNSNGSHGFKDKFLIEFIEELKIDKFFKTQNSKVLVEYFVGSKNDNSISDGRIDILIEDDKKNRIIIENKIYAGEQENQLQRYYNFDNKATILFLSLFGSESQYHEKFDKYTIVSYGENIVNWLEKCQKIAVENPIVRETIKQYKNLIKKLTYQNINSLMEEKLIELITVEGKKDNFESFISLVGLQNNVYHVAVKNHLVPIIEFLLKEHNLVSNFNLEAFLLKNRNWLGFNFSNELMLSLGLKIEFCFNVENGVNHFAFGFHCSDFQLINSKQDLIKNLFFQHFPGSKSKKGGWLTQKNYTEYYNWEDLKTLKEIIHGDFKEDFKAKVKIMLDIINEV